MTKKDGQKRMVTKAKKQPWKPFITKKNAAEISLMRETFGGGRPRVPRACTKCGKVFPTARMAQACTHGERVRMPKVAE